MHFQAVGSINRQRKLSYQNAISGGNFPNVTGWGYSGGTIAASNNVGTLTGDGSSIAPNTQRTSTIPCASGKKVYVYAKVSVDNASCASIRYNVIGSTTNGTTQNVRQNTPVANQEYELSAVLTIPADAVGNVKIKIEEWYADAATANGKKLNMQKVIIYDLTTNGLDSHDAAWCLVNIVPNIAF